MMGIFINCLAVVFSTVMAICGISYFMREKNAGNLRYYMLIMGFFGALWSGGYGIMGFTETQESAAVFRAVGLVGVVGFMMTEALMVAYMVELPKWLFRTYAVVFGIFAAIDLFFFIPDPHTFVRINGRMCYYSHYGFRRMIHNSFLVFVAVTMIAIAIIWVHKEKPTRQVYYVRAAILSNLAILVAIIPDTILPMLGKPSFPSSAYGMFLTYMITWFWATKFNAFSITVGNLSQYIYESANTAILIFDEQFRLVLANQYGQELLKIKKMENQKLSQLFECTKEEMESLLSTILKNNMLVVNWDSSNVEDILMPCMFEDIYRIHTGENLKTEDWKIPAEEYENIMTTYFPVSVEQLRKNCKYDECSNSYEYEMIYASPYPPFGEVVDYKENTDGTITLIVDGVWPDYNSDLAFRNEIVVQPFEDGTFRYLSNSIEQIELELPPIAKAH